MYYTQEQIDRANQADLVSFLQSQGEQLTRAGNEYRWKRHDSLTVRGNKWYRHSQSKGGGPVDFVMEFFGKSFTEAVELLTGEKGAAPPPDRPCPASLSDFRLPPPNSDNRTARNYLTTARRIDEDVTGFFFARGDIYEDAAHHNAVFVGRDEDGIPRYAHSKGTAGNFRLDVKGSDKAFNFCYRGEGERLFVFEAPIDLISFLCLFKKEWQKQSYLSLGGVGEKALLRFLSDRPNIKTVYLCLDSDEAGNDACSRLVKLMPEGYTVHRLIPLFKDWNEVLQHRAEITDGKYIREAVYGLKEPPQEETVEIIRMSEVDTQTVEWLWEPYIPFGKVTIVQGNPGEGKTTFALRLAAACTNRKPFPHMAAHEPFNVIYQTAEDGLGDTIKPRLMEAEADLDRVLVIDESKQGLSLSDERIERAIRQTGARLIILDPIQAYMGEKTDMNRANEVRPMFRRLADVAERTGCAVILIGHLNKAAGGQSAYRGLGSIDFRAAARSVLLIGRVKREPNVQDRLVALHDLDCPWRPGDLAQRKGRIERQGNKNPLVHVYRYVTEGTFDAYLWQTVENKQKFISQIMTSKSPVRSCDDVDETALSFAEIKALCAGDPRIKERMDLDVEVSKLKLMKADHQSKQYRLEDQLLKYFPEEIEKHKGFIQGFEADLETLAAHPHPEDGFAGMEIRGDVLTDKENAGAALLDACKEVKDSEPVQIGSYRGFTMSVEFSAWKQEYTLLLKGQMTHRASLGIDPRGNLTRIDNALSQMPQRLEATKAQLDNLYQQQAAAKEEVGKPFPYEDDLRVKSARLVELDTLLNLDGKGRSQPESVIAKSARPSVLDSLKRPVPPRSPEKKPKQHEEVR